MRNPSSFDIPKDLHYDRDHHLWVKPDAASGRARVGIDAIGLESLGELAYVALGDVGTTVARGDSIGTLEAAKMTTHIVAPVGGRIVARNDRVLADPVAVNKDPYDGGWLIELETADWARDAAALVSGDAIQGWVKSEVARLDAENQAENQAKNQPESQAEHQAEH